MLGDRFLRLRRQDESPGRRRQSEFERQALKIDSPRLILKVNSPPSEHEVGGRNRIHAWRESMYQDDAQLEVVIEAARLFNHFGYDVASLDLVERELRVRASADAQARDLLNDREALAAAAFDYAVEQTNSMLYAAADGADHSVDQLSAIIAAFRSFVENPPVEGGCPIFTAALQWRAAVSRGARPTRRE